MRGSLTVNWAGAPAQKGKGGEWDTKGYVYALIGGRTCDGKV